MRKGIVKIKAAVAELSDGENRIIIIKNCQLNHVHINNELPRSVRSLDCRCVIMSFITPSAVCVDRRQLIFSSFFYRFIVLNSMNGRKL